MLLFIAQMKKHRMGINEKRMNIFPFLSINHSCDEAMLWAKAQLTQAGLHPVQTFDLHTARNGLCDCPCPNHGTNDCDCQMVVLLIYGDTGVPETLILHGNGEETWLSITDSLVSNATGSLVEDIKDILMGE